MDAIHLHRKFFGIGFQFKNLQKLFYFLGNPFRKNRFYHSVNFFLHLAIW